MRRFALILYACLALGASPAGAAFEFQWLGVSGFVLRDGATTLAFDPVITRPSFWKLITFQKVRPDEGLIRGRFASWRIPKLDGTFISHAHFDHVIDAPTIVREYGGRLYGSTSARMVGLGHGLPDARISVLEAGKPEKVGKFKITAFRSPHGALLFGWGFASGEITKPVPLESDLWQYRCGESYGFYIEHPDGNFVYQQTAGLPSPDPLEGKRASVVFLSLAGRHQAEDLIRERVLKLGASIVIPVHYDNFFAALPVTGRPSNLPHVNLESFEHKLQEMNPRARWLMPEPGVLLPLPTVRQVPAPER